MSTRLLSAAPGWRPPAPASASKATPQRRPTGNHNAEDTAAPSRGAQQIDRRQQRKRVAQDFNSLDDDSAPSSTPPPSIPKLVCPVHTRGGAHPSFPATSMTWAVVTHRVTALWQPWQQWTSTGARRPAAWSALRSLQQAPGWTCHPPAATPRAAVGREWSCQRGRRAPLRTPWPSCPRCAQVTT